MGCGRHATTSFCSLAKRNLFPAGPQITAVFSPSIFVLKTCGEYFFILSPTNFSGFPYKNSMVSPIIGHPKLPGGSLVLVAELFLEVKMPRARAAMVRNAERERKKSSMFDVYLHTKALLTQLLNRNLSG